MEWKDWKPWYDEIAADLDLDPARDMESAKLLASLLTSVQDGIGEVGRLIDGREAVILGPAPFSPGDMGGALVISAGSATGQVMSMGIVPDIVVTDLDGDVGAQVEANLRGAAVAIHAHGDNMNTLEEWVPRFRPPLIGTTQNEPFGCIRNFGGFTDGDRAVFLAARFGAIRITLLGFDLDNPVCKFSSNPELKRKKLVYARRLIEYAGKASGLEIIH